jgi:hypothetical protein
MTSPQQNRSVPEELVALQPPRPDPNTFALKTIFGSVTDKELDRYTRDFDREAEAVGMLIKLNERRKIS